MQQMQQQQQQRHMFQNITLQSHRRRPLVHRAVFCRVRSRGPCGMTMRGGRGWLHASRERRSVILQPPARPALPSTPPPQKKKVPTGPRNQNKYRDRDNDAQAVDGLAVGLEALIGVV